MYQSRFRVVHYHLWLRGPSRICIRSELVKQPPLQNWNVLTVSKLPIRTSFFLYTYVLIPPTHVTLSRIYSTVYIHSFSDGNIFNRNLFYNYTIPLPYPSIPTLFFCEYKKSKFQTLYGRTFWHRGWLLSVDLYYPTKSSFSFIKVTGVSYSTKLMTEVYVLSTTPPKIDYKVGSSNPLLPT